MSQKRIRISILLVSAMVIGILAGAIMGAVGGQLYLIVVSPALAALGAGVLTAKAIWVLRIPQTKPTYAAGALAGVCAMIAILMVSYQMQRAAIVSDLSSVKGYSDAKTQEIINAWEAKQAGQGSLKFLQLRINSGVRLVQGTVIDLGKPVNTGLLVIESLAAVLIAWRVVRKAAKQPFCERCDHWYGRRVVGTAALGSQTSLKSSLKNHQYFKLGRRLSDPSLNNPVRLHGRFCDTCEDGQVILELEVTEVGNKAVIVQTTLASHSDLDAILDAKLSI